jgi:hypothetical protein
MKRWAASAGLMVLYIQCRAMYLPIFWMGFPAYTDWATFKDFKPGTEMDTEPVESFFFINRDMPRLFALYVYVGVMVFMAWVTSWPYWLCLAVLFLVSLIVFSYNWLIMRHRVKKYIHHRNLDEATENTDSHVGN